MISSRRSTVGPHPRDGAQRPLGQQRGGGVPRERARARRLAHRAVAGEHSSASARSARGRQRADAALVAQAREQAARSAAAGPSARLVEVDECETRGAEDRVLGVRVAVQAHALLSVVIGGGEGVGELLGVEGNVGRNTAMTSRVLQRAGRQALEGRNRRRRPAMQRRQSRPERRERLPATPRSCRCRSVSPSTGSMAIAPSAAS